MLRSLIPVAVGSSLKIKLSDYINSILVLGGINIVTRRITAVLNKNFLVSEIFAKLV